MIIFTCIKGRENELELIGTICGTFEYHEPTQNNYTLCGTRKTSETVYFYTFYVFFKIDVHLLEYFSITMIFN